MTVKYPPLSEPVATVESLRVNALAVKETLEILTRQRGDRSLSAVTWQDLVALGLITQAQVPVTPSKT